MRGRSLDAATTQVQLQVARSADSTVPAAGWRVRPSRSPCAEPACPPHAAWMERGRDRAAKRFGPAREGAERDAALRGDSRPLRPRAGALLIQTSGLFERQAPQISLRFVFRPHPNASGGSPFRLCLPGAPRVGSARSALGASGPDPSRPSSLPADAPSSPGADGTRRSPECCFSRSTWTGASAPPPAAPLPDVRGLHARVAPVRGVGVPTLPPMDAGRRLLPDHPLPPHRGRRAARLGGGGTGPVLVKAANWLTHLEYEWESPVWRHWIQFFADHFRFVRYDERGCGMTDWDVGDLVVRALGRGPRGGGRRRAAAGAVRAARHLAGRRGRASPTRSRHPERVSRLVLYGGYARGCDRAAATPRRARVPRDASSCVRVGWGKDNPAFRQVFTSRFIPGGEPTSRSTGSTSCAARRPRPRSRPSCSRRAATVDVDGAARRRCRRPTLVLHARDDEVVPARGRAAPGRRHPRRAVRRARLAQPHPARATSRPGQRFQRGGARVHAASAAPAAARTGVRARSRRASARCWRC